MLFIIILVVVALLGLYSYFSFVEGYNSIDVPNQIREQTRLKQEELELRRKELENNEKNE